jgi:uncharacterized membrane protein
MSRLGASRSDRRLAVLAALAVLSFLFVAMIVAREWYTGYWVYQTLTWNLFLAWVPLVLALLVYDGVRRGAGRVPLLVLGGLWLLFFPNAPYLVTDLKYVGWYDAAPLWYDTTLLMTGAVAGLALGFTSLYLVHAVARRFWGALNAWLGVGVVLVLGSFGIFVGRFLRWNSWDVFTDPGPLARQLADGLANPLDYPRALAVTAVFTAFLGSTYLLFYAFARLSNALGDA